MDRIRINKTSRKRYDSILFKTILSTHRSMITGSLGVSFRFPQLFLSQHRLQQTESGGSETSMSQFPNISLFIRGGCILSSTQFGGSRGSEFSRSSKNYINPWDFVSLGVESSQAEVPWVNESATPKEWLHPRVSRYVYGLPPQGWLHAWRVDSLLFGRTCLHTVRIATKGWKGVSLTETLCKTITAVSNKLKLKYLHISGIRSTLPSSLNAHCYLRWLLNVDNYY